MYIYIYTHIYIYIYMCVCICNVRKLGPGRPTLADRRRLHGPPTSSHDPTNRLISKDRNNTRRCRSVEKIDREPLLGVSVKVNVDSEIVQFGRIVRVGGPMGHSADAGRCAVRKWSLTTQGHSNLNPKSILKILGSVGDSRQSFTKTG